MRAWLFSTMQNASFLHFSPLFFCFPMQDTTIGAWRLWQAQLADFACVQKKKGSGGRGLFGMEA
jgi:hypothetical protein